MSFIVVIEKSLWQIINLEVYLDSLLIFILTVEHSSPSGSEKSVLSLVKMLGSILLSLI